MLDDVELRELRIFLAVLVAPCARPARTGPVQEHGQAAAVLARTAQGGIAGGAGVGT